MIPRYVTQLNAESCDGHRNSLARFIQNACSVNYFTVFFLKGQAFPPNSQNNPIPILFSFITKLFAFSSLGQGGL